MRSLEERFWGSVRKTDTCWWWTLGINFKGYGRISVNGKDEKAHRVSWKLHYGKIPDGMFVCHTCDNPACVRPDHLFLGTANDNVQDMIRKGRYNHIRGISTSLHKCKLTQEEVNEIRNLGTLGVSYKKIGRLFKINRSHVWRILSGRAWRSSYIANKIRST